MAQLSVKKRVGRLLEPLMRLLFRTLQQIGLHLVRNHFYCPVPDTRRLPEKIWIQNSELVGVKMELEDQLRLLDVVFPDYLDECNFPGWDTGVPHEFHFGNWCFEALDAEVLYCFVRHFKPTKVIEVGSGNSTYIIARAAVANSECGVNTEVTAIDPYPNMVIAKGFPGLTRLITIPVEEVRLDTFQELRQNDLLFIDSSHVVKIGNDVVYEYLEILPRLNPGVLIHIHDIFLPSEYPKEWVIGQHKFWNEQYLLQAFLAFNDSFQVIWASSLMSMIHAEKLEATFPAWKGSYKELPGSVKKRTLTRDGENVWPVSFWLRKTK